MISKSKEGISIIIPTYNEEKTIIKTLEGIRKCVHTEKEVIIVDDSKDETEVVVKKYSQNYPWVAYVKNGPKNKGFVKALYVGTKHARKEIVVFVMADQCDDPRTIDKMYKIILRGWDVVCGSRYMKGGKRLGGPEAYGILSKYLCLLSFYLIGVSTHDVTNSYKMYKKDVLSKLKFNFKAETAVSMELLCQAYFKDFKITETATTWKGRSETKFKLSRRGPKYFKILKWGMENRLRKIIGLSLRKFYK